MQAIVYLEVQELETQWCPEGLALFEYEAVSGGWRD